MCFTPQDTTGDGKKRSGMNGDRAGRCTTKRDAGRRRPWFVLRFLPCRVSSSGESWLAVQYEHVVLVTGSGGKRVVLFLKPHKLGFQVANALLETAHLGDHAGIGTADVAE
jgi:hypothetical protein